MAMGWFSRKKDKPGKPSPPGPSADPTLAPETVMLPVPPGLSSAVDLELPLLSEQLERLLPHVLEQQIDRPLVHARLSDAYRDAGEPPMLTEQFALATEPLDEEGWRRLALLVGLLDESHCREGLELLLEEADDDTASTQMQEAFINFAHDTSLLSVATLRGSELRREEFLRRWMLRLGVGVTGESVKTSLDRLARLDYGTLLDEAEKARQIAQERMAYLKKLQEAEDASRRPRGKW